MPYELRKQGDKWCVFNKDTKESKGCSDTREMAVKHMRALYVNEKALEIDCQCATCTEARKEYEDVQDQALDVASIVASVVSGVKSLFVQPQAQSIVLTKQADGRLRVLLRVSNMFKDRHEEIITSAAHKEYEAYVAESQDYPEFWLWHTPGSRWGQADLVSFDDGFLTMSGLVDQGKEYIAYGLQEHSKDIGVSHGFRSITVQGKGYIDWYRTFEASPLPREAAANLWTGYMLLAKERAGMSGLLEKHKRFFDTLHIPEDVVAAWDSSNKQLGDVLREAGIDYKEAETPAAPAVAETVPVASASTLASAMPVANADTTSDPVLEELRKLNARFDGLEAKQKQLEDRVSDSVASTLEAAIVPGVGSGFVASKEGPAPSETEKKQDDSWLLELIEGRSV